MFESSLFVPLKAGHHTGDADSGVGRNSVSLFLSPLTWYWRGVNGCRQTNKVNKKEEKLKPLTCTVSLSYGAQKYQNLIFFQFIHLLFYYYNSVSCYREVMMKLLCFRALRMSEVFFVLQKHKAKFCTSVNLIAGSIGWMEFIFNGTFSMARICLLSSSKVLRACILSSSPQPRVYLAPLPPFSDEVDKEVRRISLNSCPWYVILSEEIPKCLHKGKVSVTSVFVKNWRFF